MPGPHSTLQISMNEQTRTFLQRWLRCPKAPAGLVRRARALLLLEQGYRYAPTAKQVGLTERNLRKWVRRFREQGVAGLYEQPRPGRAPVFPPRVALYVVKLACERPDQVGRALSLRDCPALACQLKADGIVQSISPETIRSILHSHKLKPWRSTSLPPLIRGRARSTRERHCASDRKSSSPCWSSWIGSYRPPFVASGWFLIT